VEKRDIGQIKLWTVFLGLLSVKKFINVAWRQFFALPVFLIGEF
jgi:hypothetical protein